MADLPDLSALPNFDSPDATPQELWELLDPSIPRLLHSGEEWTGQPFIYINDDGVEIAAGLSDQHDKGICVTAEFGTQITGPMSFCDTPQNISMGGGYYVFNPMLLTAIGSSAAMPIPTLVYSTPRVLAAAQDIGSIGTLLGVN
jgi:hypothetical protein